MWTRAAFFTGCCCNPEIVVVGHTKGTTPQGTGSLSRISPDDGSVIWTADLGSDTISGGSHPRIPFAVDLDSRGNVYAFWQNSTDTSGKQQGYGTTGHKQGVKKFDVNGNLVASYNLPNSNGGIATFSSAYAQHGKVRVDPNDDDRVYVGCHYDTANKWLYRLDSLLATVAWSVGSAETAAGSQGRSVGLAVTSDGSIYIGNYPATAADTIWKLSDSGSVIDSDNSFLGIGLFLDPSDRVRVPEDGIATSASGYATFPTTQFARFYTEFPTPATGTWDAATPSGFYGTCGYATGSRCVFGSTLPIEWTPSTGPDQPEACFVVSDASGSPTSSGYWTNGGTIAGLAYNPRTGNAYCAGTGFASGSGRLAGKIDPLNNLTTWSAKIMTTPAGDDRGWSIAARSCRI